MSKNKNEQYNHISVNHKQAVQLMGVCYKAKKAMLMYGDYGIGKTSLARQFAREIDADGCIVFTSVDQSIFDVQMPYLVESENEKVTHFAISKKIPRRGRWVFLVDEINTRPMSVQPMLYNMILEHQIGDVVLPDDSMFIGACNRLQDGCAAQPLSAALPDRFGITVNLTVDPKLWAEYATASHILPEIVSFARSYPQVLEGQEPNDPAAGCTPRSLETLSQLMTAGIPHELENIAFMGCIGKSAGSTFIGHLDMYRNEVHIEKILKSPDKYPIPEDVMTVYAVLCALVQITTYDNFSTVFRFIKRLRSSHQMMYMIDLLTLDAKYRTTKEFNKFLEANHNIMF